MNNKKDCSCNGNRKDVIRKIEEANRNIKYRYVPGPKGEKGDQGERGEQGPATINIGKIETVAPDQNAEVVNSGTNIDAVLDFKIPKGEKGEKGEKGDQGEKGFPGEIGISEVITIDETITNNPGEEAEVLDDKEGNVHHLTFYIPKGEKGEKGDQGPKGDKGEPAKVEAYSMKYSNQNVPLQLSRMADKVVPLNEEGKSYHIDNTQENSIKIQEEGYYQISYYLSGTPNVSASLTVTVRNNDILMAGTNLKTKWEPNTLNNVSNTVIAELLKDDVINLNVRADSETTLTFNDGTTAVLTLIKIG